MFVADVHVCPSCKYMYVRVLALALTPHLTRRYPDDRGCPCVALSREGEEGGETANDQLQVTHVNYPINCRGQLKKNHEGGEKPIACMYTCT